MDADEFLRSGLAAQTGSRLDPYKSDIEKLLVAGCQQIVVLQFLEKNGVHISKAGLSKYLRSRPELAKYLKPRAVLKNTRRPTEPQEKKDFPPMQVRQVAQKTPIPAYEKKTIAEPKSEKAGTKYLTPGEIKAARESDFSLDDFRNNDTDDGKS